MLLVNILGSLHCKQGMLLVNILNSLHCKQKYLIGRSLITFCGIWNWTCYHTNEEKWRVLWAKNVHIALLPTTCSVLIVRLKHTFNSVHACSTTTIQEQFYIQSSILIKVLWVFVVGGQWSLTRVPQLKYIAIICTCSRVQLVCSTLLKEVVQVLFTNELYHCLLSPPETSGWNRRNFLNATLGTPLASVRR